MTDSDAALEARIETAKLQMLYARTPAQRGRRMDELRRLIAQRTPERVKEMEKERGMA